MATSHLPSFKNGEARHHPEKIGKMPNAGVFSVSLREDATETLERKTK
jgi:hypothetical protein